MKDIQSTESQRAGLQALIVVDEPVETDRRVRAMIGDIAAQVEHLVAKEFKQRGFDTKFAPMYSQMLVGMAARTGQWWLDDRKPNKADVAAHIDNLAWNGLQNLEPKPRAVASRKS